MTEPTDSEIIALADETRTAEGGANGYVLPISFARAVLAKWGTPQAVAGEPVGWVWQHEETGRTGFVDCWQVENGWQENNPRLRLVSKLYTHPQPAAQDAERYRLLNLGVDVIQADDEFLSDDTTTWGTDPNGVFVGMPYQGYALLPARRKVDAAIAAQQGDSHE